METFPPHRGALGDGAAGDTIGDEYSALITSPTTTTTTTPPRILREAGVIRLETLSERTGRALLWGLAALVFICLFADIISHEFYWGTSEGTSGPFYPHLYNPDNRTVVFNSSVELPKRLTYFSAVRVKVTATDLGLDWVPFNGRVKLYAGRGRYEEVVRRGGDIVDSLKMSGVFSCGSIFGGCDTRPGYLLSRNIHINRDEIGGAIGALHPDWVLADEDIAMSAAVFLELKIDGFSFNESDAKALIDGSDSDDDVDAFLKNIEVTLSISKGGVSWLDASFRYFLMGVTIYHFIKFSRIWRSSIDALRPEYSILRWGFIFLVLLCGPFCFLGALHNIKSFNKTLAALLLFQIPTLATHYFKAALWAILQEIGHSASLGRSINGRPVTYGTEIEDGDVYLKMPDGGGGGEEKETKCGLVMRIMATGWKRTVHFWRSPERQYACWRRVVKWFTLFLTFQIAFMIASESAAARISEDTFYYIPLAWKEITAWQRAKYIIHLLWNICNFVLQAKIAIALFSGVSYDCCLFLWFKGISTHLNSVEYFATRDRQLLVRLMRVMVVLLIIWLVLDSDVVLETNESGLGVPTSNVFLSVVCFHILTWCMCPVFTEDGSKLMPPTPCTDEWKTMRWDDSVVVTQEKASRASFSFQQNATSMATIIRGGDDEDRNAHNGTANSLHPPEAIAAPGNWIRTTPGAMSLYVFATIAEEERFLLLNAGSRNKLEQIHFFNFEILLGAMHFSGEAYRLDSMSPCTAAATAALCILFVTKVSPEGARNLSPYGHDSPALSARVDYEEDDDNDDADTAWGTSVRLQDDAALTLSERFSNMTKRAKVVLVSLKSRLPERQKPARLCMDGTSPDCALKYELLHVSLRAHMQILFIRWNGRFVISFRGSDSVDNWKSDLQMNRELWEEMRGLELRPPLKSCFGCRNHARPLVHRGFAKMWRKIKPFVVPMIQNLRRPGEPLLFTGHSLGGAMATLASYVCARDLQVNDPGSSVEVCTFGCPLVGNQVFTVLYNDVVPRHMRVVNKNDLITWATVPFQKNMHVGKLVFVAAETGMASVEPSYFEQWFSPKASTFSPCGIADTALFHTVAKYRLALSSAFFVHKTKESEKVVPSWAKEEMPKQAAKRPLCCCCN